MYLAKTYRSRQFQGCLVSKMKNGFLLAVLSLLLLLPSAAGATEPWREGNAGLEFVGVTGGCYQVGQDGTENEELRLLVGDEGAQLAFGDELPAREVCAWPILIWAAMRDRAAAAHRGTNLGFRLVYSGK